VQIDFVVAVTLGAITLGAVVNVVMLISKREFQVSMEARRDAKLDHIFEKVDYIALNQKALEDILKQHAERITVVEQSNKAVWHRLDDVICEIRKI